LEVDLASVRMKGRFVNNRNTVIKLQCIRRKNPDVNYRTQSQID